MSREGREGSLTSGYLMFVPLCRERTPALRIKVGTIGCPTPIGESATRVIIDTPVADEIWLTV